MLGYIVVVFISWCLYKLVQITWTIYINHQLTKHLPALPDQHWFWGVLQKVTNLDDILKLTTKYVTKATPTVLITWVMFFFPVLNSVHPSTMKVVLTTQHACKNKGISGAYRMMRPWLGDGLLTSDGKKNERNRRLLTPAFHFDILRSYIEVFNHISDTFCNRIKESSRNGTSFDIYPMVSRATLDTMLRCTLSYNDDSVQSAQTPHPYVAAVTRLLFLLTDRTVNPLYYIDMIYSITPKGREFKRLTDYVHEFSSNIIENRRSVLATSSSKSEKRHLDFLDTLLTAKDEEGQGLSDKEIRDEVDTFMFEGHDTTASAVSWCLNCLAKYPIMQQSVRQEVQALIGDRQHFTAKDLPELQYTTRFIKEVMRLYPPVALTQRVLNAPLTIQGTKFPEGQQIDVYHYVVHRNPAVWENPEEFRPERFLPENISKQDPFAFIPFSAGPRASGQTGSTNAMAKYVGLQGLARVKSSNINIIEKGFRQFCFSSGNCIGQNFAMNEIKIIISKMVNRFRIYQDPEKEAVPFPEGVMRSKNGIFLRFEDI